MEFDLQQSYYGNTVKDYLLVITALVVGWLILQLIKRWIIKYAKAITGKTDNLYDDVLVSIAEKFFIPYLYLVINFNIIRQLNLSISVDRVLEVALTVITVIFAARLINYAIHFSIEKYMKRREEGPARMKQLTGILLVIKVIIWLLGILFFLDNVGYKVTTVVAGLGVGGIAIALAAQNILGDLFSYFVIFFDKPFEVGDFIAMGDKSGTVERIGIKTSHVRSVAGEQLVMPNAELVKSVIHNYKRQEKRRITFKIGVSYDTTAEQLASIPNIIKQAIENNEKTLVERSHLLSLGDSSINFETIYLIDSADYNVYMDINQAVNLEVLRQFRDRGIDIAYPSRKLIIETLNKENLSNENFSTIINNINEERATDKGKI